MVLARDLKKIEALGAFTEQQLEQIAKLTTKKTYKGHHFHHSSSSLYCQKMRGEQFDFVGTVAVSAGLSCAPEQAKDSKLEIAVHIRKADLL